MAVRSARGARRLSTALGRLGLVVGAPLAFFAVCELALWLLGVTPLADDPEQRAWLRFRSCQLEWRAAARFCDPTELRSSRRIVVALGGSSVAGYPRGKTVPFPATLQALLDARAPHEFRVFNRGHRGGPYGAILEHVARSTVSLTRGPVETTIRS